MRRWAWVGAAVITAIALTVVSLPDAGAQKVANPGSFTITPSGGAIIINTTALDLTPRVNPECSDGIDNDGLTGIDFPADPQCTSALDDSELAGGLQTKVDTSLTGTIDGAGVINVPTTGVVLPPAYIAVPDTNPANYPYVVKATVIPTAAATGSLNPLTGEASIRLRFRIQITGSPFGVYTGASCSIGTSAAPIDINVLTTGTTAPPAPATPISGFPYLSNGTFRMVNNSFSVPGATGCAALLISPYSINALINQQLGLPSAAGNNSATLDGLTSPVLTRGIAAKITTTPALLSGESPFTVTFDSAASTVTKTPATYLWQFPDGTTSNATSVTKTFTNVGTNTVRLTITDPDGDSSTVQKNVSVLAPTTTTTTTTTTTLPPTTTTTAPPTTTTTTTTTLPPTTTTTAPPTTTTTTTTTLPPTTTTTLPANVAPTAVANLVSTAGLTANLTGASSSDPDGTIVSYNWNFGDSSTATSATPTTSHAYAAAGTYTVTLTVFDNQGASGQTSIPVTVTAPTTTTTTTTTTLPPTTTTTTTTLPPTTTTTAPPTTTTTTTTSTTTTTTLPPTTTTTLPANVAPTAVIGLVSTSGLTANLTGASSSDPDGTIVSYNWNFGDSSTATSATPTTSHAYASAGTYTVTLTVFDNQGASGQTTASVTVIAPTTTTTTTTTTLPPTTTTTTTTTLPPTTTTTAPPTTTTTTTTTSPPTTTTTTTTTLPPTTTTTTTTTLPPTTTTTTTTVPPTTTTTTTVPPTTTTTVPTTTTTTVPALRDRYSVQLSGSYNYNRSGDSTAGNMAIVRDQYGVVSVNGTLSYPGANGGTGQLTVASKRFWVFPLWSGQVQAWDPGAGVSVTAPIFGQISPTSGTNAVRSQSSWFSLGSFPNLVRPFTINWSIDDRA